MAIIDQDFLETLAGKEDAAFDSAEREMDMFGNLGIFITGDMHTERDPIVVAERVDGVLDFNRRD